MAKNEQSTPVEPPDCGGPTKDRESQRTLITLNEGDRIQFDPRGYELEKKDLSVESQFIFELKKSGPTSAFDNAKQAIKLALEAMRKVASNRECSLVITKLQEAQHWLEAEPYYPGIDHCKK